MPRRWSGKTAALLPTWPKATEDWMVSSSMPLSSRSGTLVGQTRTGYSCGARHIPARGVPRWSDDDEVSMAKQAPYRNEADYVVVGSGSSGAAVAGRLAQSGASVIVLEAGKGGGQVPVQKPRGDGAGAARPKN